MRENEVVVVHAQAFGCQLPPFNCAVERLKRKPESFSSPAGTPCPEVRPARPALALEPSLRCQWSRAGWL